MIPRFVSETVEILNEKNGNPIVGVIIAIVIFIVIGVCVMLLKE